MMKKILIVLSCLAITAGCANLEKQSQPSIVRDRLPGYLASNMLPVSEALLPSPPSEGSAAFALDEDVSRNSLALRGSSRWIQATEDADMAFPKAAGHFSCALNAQITEQDTPHLYTLMRRVLSDVGHSVSKAKKRYMRPRPFVVNRQPTCSPDYEKIMKKDGSYPSGHSAAGWAWALILSEISPGQADAILARGRTFGQSRVVCNVHWESDVIEGRTVAAAVVALLHADPLFRSDLDAARIELEAARSKALKHKKEPIYQSIF